MEPFFVRYRNLLVLLALLVAQIVGLAVQVRKPSPGSARLESKDGKGVRLIRLWANAIVSPPERLIHSSKLGIDDLWQNYIDLRGVRRQNQDLQRTINRLRLEQASLLEDARQGERLQALLHFQQKYIYQTVAAQVIGTSGSQQSRIITLDKGADAGLKRDMAVITPQGIVGKVREVYPRSAQVLLINDQTSGAGVMLQTTRIRGILTGNPSGQAQVVGIMADQRLKPGEAVLTAGGDEVFPRGLPVGVVWKIVPDPVRDAFVDILVKPAAQLDSLDEVLVITSTEPRISSRQLQDMATSEAVMGAEAAEQKAQRKASEIMSDRLPGLIEPNVPADQQPIHDSAPPNPISAQPPQPLHPDRFSPVPTAASDGAGGQAGSSAPSPAKPAGKPQPRRNP